MSENDTGNAAAMREALRTLRQRFDNDVMAYQDRYFKFVGWHWHKKAAEAERWRDVFSELRDVCDAALAAPARNCDVGTAKEQAIRKEAYCQRYSPLPSDSCDNCPLRGYNRASPEHMVGYSCDLAWAQMPYDADMPNYTRMQEAFNRYRNNPSLHMKESEVFKPFKNLHEALKADPNDPRWDEVCQEKSTPKSAEGVDKC